MFMSDTHKPITDLVIKYVMGTATPIETTQLEEWASLSTENRNWLDRFNNPDYLQTRLKQIEEINIEASVRNFKRRLHEHNMQTKKAWTTWYRVSYTVCFIICACIITNYIQLRFHDPVIQQKITYTTIPRKETLPKTVDTSIKEQHTPKITKHTPGKKQPQSALPVNNITEEEIPVNHELEEGIVQNTATNGLVPTIITGAQLKKHAIANLDKAILQDHYLPDRSLITLNAASSIQWLGTFQGDSRKIELTGEAYIQALYADSYPFIVIANKIRIETAGGNFNIRSYDNEQQTIITAISGDSLVIAVGPHKTAIQSGQMAVIVKGAPIDVYNRADTDKIMAYTNQLFHFRNDNLNLVAMEIARWYNLTLVGAAPPNVRVSFRGSRKNHCKEVIKNLRFSDKRLHLKVKDSKLIIE
jgi:FecR-like protein